MASSPTFVTSNEAQIAVSVAGITFPSYIKTWKTFQGGDPTASTGIIQPGAGVKGVARPGPVSRTNVVVGIPYTLDLHGIKTQLDEAMNAAMTAGYTPTDAGGNPNTDVQVSRNGLVNKVEVGAFDAENGKEVMLQITMECNT